MSNVMIMQKVSMFYKSGECTKLHKDVEIIKPKIFKKAKKEGIQTYDGQELKVVGATCLKQVSPKYIASHPGEKYLHVKEPDWNEGRDYLLCDVDDKFVFSRSVGYAPVSDSEYILVYQNLLAFILLFFGVCLLGLLLALRLTGVSVPEDTKQPLKEDDSQTEWNGELPNVNGDVPEQENIEIPGFYKFTASADAGHVPLYNPETNTVYFQYSIYEILSSAEVTSFDTASEAQDYIQSNSVEYSLKNDNGYYLVDENGNKIDTVVSYKSVPSGDKFTIIEERLSAVYGTDMVSPGKQVLWNAYESLGTGEYMLKMVINTYDIETGGECYGAVQTVEAVIN